MESIVINIDKIIFVCVPNETMYVWRGKNCRCSMKKRKTLLWIATQKMQRTKVVQGALERIEKFGIIYDRKCHEKSRREKKKTQTHKVMFWALFYCRQKHPEIILSIYLYATTMI